MAGRYPDVTIRTVTGSGIRVAAAAVVALLLATTHAVSAAASSAIRPAPGTPDPRLMVLTSADLGGARVTAQGYYKDKDFPSVISYSREFEDGRAGSTLLPYVASDVEIGTSVSTTTNFLLSFRALLATKQGRKLIAESMEEEIPGDGLVSNVQVGRPRNLGVGPGSWDVIISVRVLGTRTELHMAAFRVERALGVLVAWGVPGRRVPLATMTRLAKIMAARMTAELGPKSTAPPAISGNPTVGQTLTASTGTWTGKPTGFAYQWQRCDAAGSACVPITGAGSSTYVVADADLGRTLRVVVTARNSAGRSTSTSAPTAVIQAAGAPVNTAAPAIAGTARVGETLTASTGSWTGSPTSFGFQWLRCNQSGESCVDIPAATGGTYVVTSSDVASTIRVRVTASNGSGSATATSAPTPVVT